MAKADVDEAFEWLVLIIGIVSAIISQYPEYFQAYLQVWGELPASLVAARALILPLVLMVMMWLVGKLMTDLRYKPVVKVFAWMYALIAAFANMLIYLAGARWLSVEGGSAVVPAGLFYVLVIPGFTYKVVVARYREIYPDSTFLRSRPGFIVAYVLAFVLLLIPFLLPPSPP